MIRNILFSVVIPAFNEEKVIAKCLSALETQTLPRDAFEVIVVDNGSTDNTSDAAASFQRSLNLRILYTKASSIAAVRNFGASMANGEFLGFIDADCVAPSHWLQAAAGLLRANSSRVMGAHYLIPPQSSWLAKSWYGDRSPRKTGPVSYVPGGDLLVGREQFARLGGFDQNIETSEDCDFCQRAAAAGLAIIGAPELSVVHLGTPQSLGAFYHQQRWHGNHVHRVFWKDVRRSRVKKPLLFAAYTLCAVTAAGALTIRSLLSGSAGNAWLAVAMVLFAPFLMALHKSLAKRRLNIVGPLTLLYLVYGIARGIALLGLRAPVREGYGGASRRTPKRDAPSTAR